MNSEEKTVKVTETDAEQSQSQQPLTKDQQIANVFNQMLQLVVREINIGYSNINAILSGK